MSEKYRRTLEELSCRVDKSLYYMDFKGLSPNTNNTTFCDVKLTKLQFKHNYETCIDLIDEFSNVGEINSFAKKHILSINDNFEDAMNDHLYCRDFFNKTYAISYNKLYSSLKFNNIENRLILFKRPKNKRYMINKSTLNGLLLPDTLKDLLEYANSQKILDGNNS